MGIHDIETFKNVYLMVRENEAENIAKNKGLPWNKSDEIWLMYETNPDPEEKYDIHIMTYDVKTRELFTDEQYPSLAVLQKGDKNENFNWYDSRIKRDGI